MRTYDLTADQLRRIALSKTVPCRPRESHRGCGMPVGERCVSLATGRPLGGRCVHEDRLADAEARAAASRRRIPRPSPEPSPGRVLASA